MKNTFYTILIVSGLCFGFAACSSGDYNANPGSNANNSINPLSPLTASQFTWGGNDPFSALVNGGGFQAKTGYAGWFLDDTTGADIVVALSGKQYFKFNLLAAYTGKVYSLGHNYYKTQALYIDDDSALLPANHAFYSYLGNSGEIYIVQNDTNAIKGLFYFQGVTSGGAVVNITNGYFNVLKH